MSIQTKNQIKNRMVRKAAELWGVSPNDIDSSFDPLVALLLGSCASELSKISAEVTNSQNRIAEKLIELMSPETFSGSQPAHAIAHAVPIDPYSDIVPANQLFAKKKIKNSDGESTFKTAYFSPIKPFKLVKSDIKSILVGDILINLEDTSKSLLTESLQLNNGKILPKSTIFLGIPKTEEKISLKETSLFFELSDIANQELFYNQLKLAKFYFNEQPVLVDYGFYNTETVDRREIDKIFSSESKKISTLEYQTSQVYKKQYVTMLTDCWLDDSKANTDLLDLIDIEKHQDFTEMQWLKVVFPNTISTKMLTNVYAALNTFPVLNRRLENATYSLKDFTNIVPFSTSDLFLDIKKISNHLGKEYLSLDANNENEKGTYTLRDENIGRLDSKKAKDYLIHLLELLKNESSAFTILGNDSIRTNIQQLNQNISALEERVTAMDVETEQVHYLSLKRFVKNESIFIDFWSTIGKWGNLIKANTKLEVYKGSDIDSDKSFLVTPTSQGKNELTTDERLFRYRRSLLSRDRIVTREDIKALCYDICGNKIESVILTKEFKTHEDYDKGLIPTVVITLKKKENLEVQDIEWLMMENNIMSILEEKSTNLFPYQIELTN